MALSPTFVVANGTSDAYPTRFSHFPFRCKVREGAPLESHSQCLRRDEPLWTTIQRGRTEGIAQCKKVMKDNTWSCAVEQNSSKLFGDAVLAGTTREGAFLHALMTASLIQSIARSCGKGYLADRCPCGQDAGASFHNGQAQNWEWGNCSVNMVYGRNLVRRLANPPNARRQNQLRPRPLMQVLNNAAGELALESVQRISCRCHGVSSSCIMRTCIMVTPDLSTTAQTLAKKYRQAKKVIVARGSPDRRPLLQLARAVKQHARPARQHVGLNISLYQLHYTNESPDFCTPDPVRGIPGTRGEVCSKTVGHERECNKLCCGREPLDRKYRRGRCCKWGITIGSGKVGSRCRRYCIYVYKSYYCG
uniref:Protein Wnt n=1 Tax=Sycon ciliatum TaxID=27933 RepID=A0A077SQN3_9METZ|nr:Wnt U SciWntU [Sycon ciliatum]